MKNADPTWLGYDRGLHDQRVRCCEVLDPPRRRARPSAERCSHGRQFGVATASVFLLRYRALQSISPSTVAVYQNLTPECAILFARLYLGEPIRFGTIVGGAIIFLGAEMVRRATQPQIATSYFWAKRYLGSLAGNRTSN